jgi:galactose mutarotase-like enzyme
VVGPVHPAWVRPSDRGGIGWLDGFDEWLCRCGLISNGPPGEDQWTDERGQSRRETLTLHGPIANTPAHRLELTIDPQPPHALSLTGVVDEGGFFRQRLRLTVTYRTEPGSSRLSIHDTVENLGGSPAQMQMLYHCNFGPPLLGPGSRFAVAAREVAPLTARAAEGIDQYDTYLPPTAGYAEQNYAFLPATLPDGQAAALLHPAAADRGVLIRWHPDELPCFTVWKNTMSEAEGYVTGLEPATNFPNFRAFERERGRVRLLQPGERWQARWSIELLDTAATVAAHRSMIEEVLRSATIHRSPQGLFSKG